MRKFVVRWRGRFAPGGGRFAPCYSIPCGVCHSATALSISSYYQLHHGILFDVTIYEMLSAGPFKCYVRFFLEIGPPLPHPLDVCEGAFSETGRTLATRMKDHLNLRNPLTAVGEHCAHEHHKISKDCVKVLAREDVWLKRKVREAIKIKI